MALGSTNEVGQLRTVLLHRPGQEIARLTPRNSSALLFDAIPWLARAQAEHDAFAAVLRRHGVEVLYLRELLGETLAKADARSAITESTLSNLKLGPGLRTYLSAMLAELEPGQLADVLIRGLRNDEVQHRTVVTELLAGEDFLINPLPNALFTRDSSVWLAGQVAVSSLAMSARSREAELTGIIYAHHPRFSGIPQLHGVAAENLEGGDVLLLSEGVIAVGVGERTTPSGFERFAREVFDAKLARVMLAVPIAQQRATMHLDTIVTMLDTDTVVMYPEVAADLRAHVVTADAAASDEPLRITHSGPFLEVAADAMDIDQLHAIDTGLDPVTAQREQWDDGNNTLAIAPRLAVAYERNEITNAAMRDHGIEVIEISGSELGSGRGGPRCMSCPITREP